MKRTALEPLVCPDTLKPLTLQIARAEGDDVQEGELIAGERKYSIRGGIPSFVSQNVSDDQTVKSFAQKWDKHRYYREHTRKFYTEWYVQRYGFNDVDGLRAFLADKKYVLDAGTGAGRDASNFAQYSDATVYGADTAWYALEVASRDPQRPNYPLVHADVNRLPFPDEFFDFINCDQVIHHTPDPPTTFKNLAKKLKKGGEVTCYVYRKKSAVREFTDDYIRDRIKELSIDQALEVCEGITKLGKALADLKATIEIDDIPVLGIKGGKYDVQRFMHWHVLKCFWNDDFDFFTNNIVNVDWYHPIYCFRYEPEEFRSWFQNGWEILAWDEQEAGLSCRAKKI
jgi:SAM-dependent methyltransferase